MKKLHFIMISLLFISISCSSDSGENTVNLPPDLSTLYFPPVNSSDWETITIQDLGWNVDQEQPLYDFLESKGTKGFIILKSGRIVVEQYFNGGSASDNNPWYSAGKTLTAFTAGIAQQEALLNISESSSTYLGSGWANITSEQETNISVFHHLTMSTGLDYNVTNQNCTDSNCLTYLNNPGDFWYYHNAPYTLLTDIVSGATNRSYNDYFNEKVRDPIGMDGTWIRLGFANIYYSTARSMARFGILTLNKGTWDTTTILTDTSYFTKMTTPSQELNPAYGYLWWLNGKTSFRAPASEIEFNGELIPNAPDDLIAGLGKDDQKLYVVPSEDLVIVRMGDNAGEALLGSSSFDNDLWEQLNLFIN